MICSVGACNMAAMSKPPIDSPHERLVWAREQAGFGDKADFARAVGVNPTTYRAYENGQNGFAKYAATFARRLGVTAEWLLEGGPKPVISEAIKSHARKEIEDRYPKFEETDDVEIQQWDIAYGMGAGGYLDIPVTGETHRFSESWIRQFTRAPASKLFFATGTGDSMSPTILDSDIVLIDTSEHEVRMADRIWAAAYGQAGIIKRLRPMPNGSVKILSDNQNVAPETAYDGELHVVGRVVAIVRKM